MVPYQSLVPSSPLLLDLQGKPVRLLRLVVARPRLFTSAVNCGAGRRGARAAGSCATASPARSASGAFGVGLTIVHKYNSDTGETFPTFKLTLVLNLLSPALHDIREIATGRNCCDPHPDLRYRP